DDDSAWTYIPLLFAICPAFVGIFFVNGSRTVTDFLFLLLMALYLQFLVKAPYALYQDARAHSISADAVLFARRVQEKAVREQKTTAAKVHRWELITLVVLIVSPFVGGFLLHYVRSSLLSSNSAAGGLVSNSNITLFVLSAFARSGSCVSEYVKRRTADSALGVESVTLISRLQQDVADLQDELAHMRDLVMDVRDVAEQGLRTDVDALLRAMRQYERKQYFQAQEVGSRVGELEEEVRRFSSGNTAGIAQLASARLQTYGLAPRVQDKNSIYSMSQRHAAQTWWIRRSVTRWVLEIPEKILRTVVRMPAHV
ncbi:uncharacterized protein V2V93DRAFT_317910, partial [Kockiozyma suomiensis]|uniref:uncharacterized protein n=1 Tax=Kockiozyma suomiensis TaxID=1337062 RepID=UPI0033442235